MNFIGSEFSVFKPIQKINGDFLIVKIRRDCLQFGGGINRHLQGDRALPSFDKYTN